MWLVLLDDTYDLPHRPTVHPCIPANTGPHASFYDLPAELRNQIYATALIQDTPIRLPYSYEKIPFTEPSLLSVSASIAAEASPIYYGCNTFESPSPASALDFLRSLPPSKIAYLRKFHPIDLVLPVSAHRRWFDALRANINRLVLKGGKGVLKPEGVFVPVRGEDGEAGWRCLRDVKGFLVVEGEEGGWRIERCHD